MVPELTTTDTHWTVGYTADRLFFEMIQVKDLAEGWEDYEDKGQKQKYYDRAKRGH